MAKNIQQVKLYCHEKQLHVAYIRGDVIMSVDKVAALSPKIVGEMLKWVKKTE